jgi:hypothetical protein
MSESSYRFQNRIYHEPRNRDNKNSDKSTPEMNSESNSILGLETLIYVIYHCRKNPIDTDNSYVKVYSNNREFVNELSQNNFGTGTWEAGWKIVKLEDNGQIAALKNDLTVWFDRTYFRLKDNDRGKPKVGEYGYVKMPKEFRNLLPGFYMVNGNKLQEENNNDILVRLYWNVQFSHAGLLVKLISSCLNNLRVPFKFKILNNPMSYPRADAAVLYIHKEYYRKSEKSINKIYSQIRDFLCYPTPFFAKTMAPGLSLAEDPKKNAESFGQNRSRLLAQSLYQIKVNKTKTIDKMIEEIGLHFKKSNININSPYMNPNSIDDYKVII